MRQLELDSVQCIEVNARFIRRRSGGGLVFKVRLWHPVYAQTLPRLNEKCLICIEVSDYGVVNSPSTTPAGSSLNSSGNLWEEDSRDRYICILKCCH